MNVCVCVLCVCVFVFVLVLVLVLVLLSVFVLVLVFVFVFVFVFVCVCVFSVNTYTRPNEPTCKKLAALKCKVAIRCINATAGLGGLWTLDSAVDERASHAATGHAKHERGRILGL